MPPACNGRLAAVGRTEPVLERSLHLHSKPIPVRYGYQLQGLLQLGIIQSRTRKHDIDPVIPAIEAHVSADLQVSGEGHHLSQQGVSPWLFEVNRVSAQRALSLGR